MKPSLLFLSLTLLPLGLVPALAQSDAGTPPLTTDSNSNAPLPQSLKLMPSAQPATLTTRRSSYRTGQRVGITFRIVNTTGKSVSYNFSTGQRFDVTVTDAQGGLVWDWARGHLFSQNLASMSLAPGKSLVYKAAWPGTDHAGHLVAPGIYTLSAKLTSDNLPAITGGVIVNTDPDPNNMGSPTRTPADSGAVRQVNPAPQVTAKTTVVIK
jgi:hypothetical protein